MFIFAEVDEVAGISPNFYTHHTQCHSQQPPYPPLPGPAGTELAHCGAGGGRKVYQTILILSHESWLMTCQRHVYFSVLKEVIYVYSIHES
jgi:hypothetical protein